MTHDSTSESETKSPFLFSGNEPSVSDPYSDLDELFLSGIYDFLKSQVYVSVSGSDVRDFDKNIASLTLDA